MTSQAYVRSTYAELMASPAIRKICTWRLPSFDTTPNSEEEVRFAKEHASSFFRAVDKSVNPI